MVITPGTLVDNRFEFQKDLGTGGYGQVWQGFDRKLQRPVAIKRLLQDAFRPATKAQVLADILDEARRIAAVNHKNIVVVHDVCETADEAFIIMELLSGGSLHTRLRDLSKKSSWISASEAFSLLRGVLEGLEAAHGCEYGAIIHRDLKPQNILFDKNDIPKLVDFGLAVLDHIDPLPTAERAISFDHAGTLGYKSPEQLAGLKLDPRSDLFNAGMVAYLLFGALHPFADERFLFTHREMVLEPYRKIPHLNRQPLPPELEPYILRLLDSNPAKRFDSATQALSEFDSVETAYRDLLQDRCLRLERALRVREALASGASREKIESIAAPESIDSITAQDPIDVNDLATGISLLKVAGFYSQAKLIYEKGGLDISQLSGAARRRVNEDYDFCGRRAQTEVAST